MVLVVDDGHDGNNQSSGSRNRVDGNAPNYRVRGLVVLEFLVEHDRSSVLGSLP